MPVNFLYPEYELVRNHDKCITCRVCERQCANEVTHYDAELGRMISDDAKERSHLQTERQLDRRGHFGNLPAGGHRRCAALFDGKPRAVPGLLGQDTHQRFPGDESVD